MIRIFRLSLLFAAVVWTQAQAQTPASASPQSSDTTARSETDRLVDELIERAIQNRAMLPSLTAHESIEFKQDEIVFFGKNDHKAEATVRMLRTSPDGKLEEFRQITELNGKPVAADQKVHLGPDFTNDFDDYQSMVFDANDRHCFSFTLAPHPNPNAPLELSISPHPDAATPPHCIRAQRGLAGIVRIDPATCQITHLEYTLPVASAQPIHSPSFLSADYAPAKVGDKTFWLPTTVTARWFLSDKRKTPILWHSRYSDYHQYSASTKILPVTPEP